MTTAMVVGTCATAAVAAWGLTAMVRRYALARCLVDVPNARSSHTAETPRGGGVAIVVVTSAALIIWGATVSSGELPIGVVLSALAVAIVGFIDDHGHVAPLVRLTTHAIAAATAVSALAQPWSATEWALAVFFVAWMTNLTNFMDGIDGIASVQTITVCVAGAALSWLVAPDARVWFGPMVLASATAGFLVWNWPPARIFMGDAGSGYIGFMVAVFTVQAGVQSTVLGWAWGILSAVFLVDATVTLLVRAARRERVFDAHRSHAYQHLALAWRRHRPVTLMVAVVNVVWLMPIAWLVVTGRTGAVAGVVLAFVPLTATAAWLGAGRR